MRAIRHLSRIVRTRFSASSLGILVDAIPVEESRTSVEGRGYTDDDEVLHIITEESSVSGVTLDDCHPASLVPGGPFNARGWKEDSWCHGYLGEANTVCWMNTDKEARLKEVTGRTAEFLRSNAYLPPSDSLTKGPSHPVFYDIPTCQSLGSSHPTMQTTEETALSSIAV